ncbi:sensor histidine kinase [Paenibacillus sp. JCM 10914]|uniref:sensor histidine kinase n=1 Tax=Paenibacillus sp. JCM 10914 TaxID=1236974 RepID=UPI0003CCA3FC|nr:sensor histidine kinase [Paenibacillus sp. JCM 10914]GAE08197.1 two-component sensor histidine kinase [Paenibacillus sp. JCM 10914]
MTKFNLFRKMVLFIFLMLIPIVGLYFYSNKTTTDVLSQELSQSNTNQLVFFQNQVNTNIDILASWPNLLLHDPDIASFRDIYLRDEYLNLDAINLVKQIQTKLSIQESSSNWRSHLAIYSPSLGRVVTESEAGFYSPEELERNVRPGWQVVPYHEGNEQRFLFVWYSVAPYSSANQTGKSNTVIKVEFDSTNFQDMLDRFKSDGRRDPFYYKPGMGVIYNRTADQDMINEMIAKLELEPLEAVESRVKDVGGKTYSVSIVLSDTTGWYLIDYIPLTDIMEPIHTSNRLFYISMSALLLMSCLAAYLLYSHVQVPIKQLVHVFRRLQAGDYSARMKVTGRTEFSFLATRFNSMVEQIQELFEHVYLEKIHVREAKLKQLQSQINPHFFYNCFSFITSMAKLRKYEAVVAMSHSLSRYFRYTTRQERELVSLSEEIEFVTHYLEIQQMRMKRLHYQVELAPGAERIELPPLVIQPLVENAVIHGIEPKSGEGGILISFRINGDVACIQVDDNGIGMSEDKRMELEDRMNKPMDEEMGCGVWNVYQRMRLRYGETAGLRYAPSPQGGIRAVLYWPISEDMQQALDQDQGGGQG